MEQPFEFERKNDIGYNVNNHQDMHTFWQTHSTYHITCITIVLLQCSKQATNQIISAKLHTSFQAVAVLRESVLVFLEPTFNADGER